MQPHLSVIRGDYMRKKEASKLLKIGLLSHSLPGKGREVLGKLFKQRAGQEAREAFAVLFPDVF